MPPSNLLRHTYRYINHQDTQIDQTAHNSHLDQVALIGTYKLQAILTDFVSLVEVDTDYKAKCTPCIRLHLLH